MTDWLDDAVILRVGHFHESDLWLKAIARGKGLMTFFAFGGAKSKRRFCGCLDVFNTIHCHVLPSRRGGYLTLREASLLAAPRELRGNWKKMGIAINCLRFMEAMRVEAEDAGNCFALLEDLRAALEDASRPPIPPIFFRLRASALLGFAPNFDTCGHCGLPIAANGYFIPDEGRIFCPSCLPWLSNKQRRHIQPVSEAAVAFLRNARATQPSQWRMDLNGQDYRACAGLIDNFVEYHLGLVWDRGCFRQA